MTTKRHVGGPHPSENDLADFLAKSLPKTARSKVEAHIACCDECLAAVVSAYEAAGPSDKKSGSGKKNNGIMGGLNIYLLLASIAFALSFVTPRYFIQLLVATLLFGIKWVADSKSAKMLVMIYDAWRHGGEKEASKVLERLGARGYE